MHQNNIVRALFGVAAASIALSAMASSAHSPAAKPSQPASTSVELDSVLHDLLAWLPGEWESYPQVVLDREAGAPADGEHEHWYRVIQRIDAPQLGEHVLYGEVYAGGKDGQLIPGQQIVYILKADPARAAINIIGSGIKDRDRYRGLHLKPELQREIQLHGESGHCDFLWRRRGARLAGQLGEDGTCTYLSPRTGKRMTWDAEWVLTPDELWVFDNGYIEGQGLWIGRDDRTHIRSYRMHPVSCSVDGGASSGTHDRGGRVKLADGRVLEVLRGPMIDTAGRWHADGLRLSLHAADGKTLLARAQSVAAGGGIDLVSGATRIHCGPAAR